MTDVQATLHAWRESGLDHVDPVRFRLIEVLAQRAQGYAGAARRVLDERLAALLAAYAQLANADAVSAPAAPRSAATAEGGDTVAHHSLPAEDGAASAQAEDPIAAAHPHSSPRQDDAAVDGHTLSALTAYLVERPRIGPQDRADAPAPRDPYPELPALDDFRAIWEHLRTDKQVQESLQQLPGENAGPLNSGNIVHRSLSLMRTLSPEYLRQFMTYLDGLSALERLCQAADPAGMLVAKLDGNRKGGRKGR
ncbi:DUF2894 domain-containing protein [Bordetella genomosp. 13]|uniref:DUF2894 domain-containing protein n=1 Tax=Bordetella genomosp. 13 TaxID=463040 RepID=UPI0011AB1F4C|nr:DUF2894 domain-containing protein [Bordetella genomosp. 13]